jgi:hypothetical protein
VAEQFSVRRSGRHTDADGGASHHGAMKFESFHGFPPFKFL